jgi:hypothetical protein
MTGLLKPVTKLQRIVCLYTDCFERRQITKTIFWVVKPCSLVADRNDSEEHSRLWGWRPYVTPNDRYSCTELHNTGWSRGKECSRLVFECCFFRVPAAAQVLSDFSVVTYATAAAFQNISSSYLVSILAASLDKVRNYRVSQPIWPQPLHTLS